MKTKKGCGIPVMIRERTRKGKRTTVYGLAGDEGILIVVDRLMIVSGRQQ